MFPFDERYTVQPWALMRDLQDRVNRLFEGVPEGARRGYPAINIWTGEDDAVVTAELPGVDPGDLDISVTGNVLTLRGIRKGPELGEDDTVHRRERGEGEFARTLELPFDVEADKVDARLERGVLHITLPRAEAARPRRIAVSHNEEGGK
jgi:HSP20 family protein